MAVGVQAIEDLGAEVVDSGEQELAGLDDAASGRELRHVVGGWVTIRREAWLPPFDVAIGYDRARAGPGHTEP
jgi:hypothetical protein